MAVPETIQPLVDKYTFHRDACIRGQEKYNEAQLRQDFTDPFFHALAYELYGLTVEKIVIVEGSAK